MKKCITFFAALVVVLLVTVPARAEIVDVTDKLVNPDFEEMMTGWTVETTDSYRDDGTFNAYRIDAACDERNPTREGYWYFKGLSAIFQAMAKCQGRPAKMYQSIEGLQNGTYVFSAVAGIVRFGAIYTDPEDRANCQGAFFFANEQDTIITGCSSLQFKNYDWCHTYKYNVPVQVTDGTLTVGQRLDEGNNIEYVSFEQARLYYCGDVTLDEARVMARSYDIENDLWMADTLKVYPMSTENFERIERAIELGKAAKTYDEMTDAEDSIRIGCAYGRVSINAFAKLVGYQEQAKEVLGKGKRAYDPSVWDAFDNLQKAEEQLEEDFANHTIGADQVDAYAADFMNIINCVRLDELWLLLDEMYAFINFPEDISEDAPCFGITSHPGYGDEDGQIPEAQRVVLDNLYLEVIGVLEEIEDNLRSATDGFAYVSKIKSAVGTALQSAISTCTMPYRTVIFRDADGNPAYETYKGFSDTQLQNDSYLKSCLSSYAPFLTTSWPCLIVSTPVMKYDHAYKSINIKVLHTMTDRTANNCALGDDGPYWLTGELIIHDYDGNRIIPASYSGTPHANKDISNLFNWGDMYYDSSQSYVAGRGYHYVTITFSEPVDAFKLTFVNYQNGNRLCGIPVEIEITGSTEAEAAFNNTVNSADNFLSTHYFGKDPFFYNNKFDALKIAFENGKSLAANGEVTDEILQEATESVLVELEKAKEVEANKPEVGKEYYFISTLPGFMSEQAHLKGLSVFQDSILWWHNTDVENAADRWLIEEEGPECMYNDNPVPTYYIKNVATGKYVTAFMQGEAADENGDPIMWTAGSVTGFYIKLGDNKAPCYFKYLDQGQFELAVFNENTNYWQGFNLNQSNNGIVPGTKGTAGATANREGYNYTGFDGGVNPYFNYAINSSTSFRLIAAPAALPYVMQASELNEEKCYHFIEGGSTFYFAADKDCAFEDVQIYDACHKPVNFIPTVYKNRLSVKFVKNVSEFYFTFDNKEGVSSITVTASTELTKQEQLDKLYDELSFNYGEGTDVGAVKDLSAYTAAMKKAAELIENGCTDEDAVAAMEAIQKAVDEIELVQPEEGNVYVIYAANRSFYDRTYLEAGYHVNRQNGLLGYNYMYPNDENYQWMFEKGETEGTWYIKNVGTKQYVGNKAESSSYVLLSNDPVPYQFVASDTATVNIACVADGCNPAQCNLQTANLSSSYYNQGGLRFAVAGTNTPVFIKELSLFTSIQDVIAEEPETPTVQGIFDLIGRRVVNPTNGLYIINGKKVLVK